TGAAVNVAGSALTGAAAGNQINFGVPPTPTNGILPYVTIAGADWGNITGSSLQALPAGSYVTTGLANATLNSNLKLSVNDNVPRGLVALNSLILVGNISVSGSSPNSIQTGAILVTGTGTINAPVTLTGSAIVETGSSTATAIFNGAIGGAAASMTVAGTGTV